MSWNDLWKLANISPSPILYTAELYNSIYQTIQIFLNFFLYIFSLYFAESCDLFEFSKHLNLNLEKNIEIIK